MPSITVSESTFEKLCRLAVPFQDTTPESVIGRLADAELERLALKPNGQGNGQASGGDVVTLNVDAHENLAHTRLLEASVDGQPIYRPKWNSLLEHLHLLAKARLGSFEAVRRASGANLRPGKHEEDGYRHVPEGDFSIQGVDSNMAWSHSLRLARALSIPISVTFEWRNKDGAALPGQTAVLEWTPPS